MQTITNFQEFLKGKTDIQVQFKGRLYKVDANGEPRQLLRKNRWGYFSPGRETEMKKTEVQALVGGVTEMARQNRIDEMDKEIETLADLSEMGTQDTAAIADKRTRLKIQSAFLKCLSPSNARPIK